MNEIHYEEDDWSLIMTADLSPESFAQHDTQQITLPNQTTIQINSTLSLSPLDMMNLAWGTHDATGHRIWMGAELWIQSLPLLSEYFTTTASQRCCRCLELGSGTGLAGIATFLYYTQSTSNNLQMVLSDNSQSALDLCRINCTQNEIQQATDGALATPTGMKSSLSLELLNWGSTIPGPMPQFNVVFATDVIYDISAWNPLLETARLSLFLGGHLLVAHVPRAALPTKKHAEQTYHEALLSYLLDTAKEHGFFWKTTLHSRDLHNFQKQQEMEESGAAILIFQLQHPYSS